MEKETVGTVKQGDVSKLYSQSDIGKLTHTSRDRVSRWIKKHKIEGQPAGNAILYPESVLEGYKKYISKPTKQAKALQKTQAYERMFKKQEEEIALLKEQSKQFQETNKQLIAQNQEILDAIKANKPQKINYDELAKAIGAGIKIPEIDYDRLADAVSDNSDEEADKKALEHIMRTREKRHGKNYGLHHDDTMEQAKEKFYKHASEFKPRPKTEDDDKIDQAFDDAIERVVEQDPSEYEVEDKHDVNDRPKKGSWFKRLFDK